MSEWRSTLIDRFSYSSLMFACLSVYALFAIFSCAANSPTIDEPGHLVGGLSIWKYGRFDVYKVNPPLMRMLASIPALVIASDLRSDYSGLPYGADRPEFELGDILIHSNSDRVRLLFFASRFVCLVFPLLLIGICMKWARELHHSKGAVLLTGIAAALSPMLLGHGSLVTPDAAAAATGVLALYTFRKWLLHSTIDNAALCGGAAGLALLSKFTWIPVFPVTAILVLPVWRRSGGGALKWLWRDAQHLTAAAVIAVLIINITFGFERSFTPLGQIPFGSMALSSSSHIGSNDKIRTVSNRFSQSLAGHFPVPLPIEYVLGIDLQMQSFDSVANSESYLMGEWKDGGWWYYYVIALLVKEPVSTLLLGICAFALIVCQAANPLLAKRESPGSSGGTKLPELRETVLLLTPAILTFLLVSSETAFNRHLRYVLPCYPFLYILIARIAHLANRFAWVPSVMTLMIGCQCVSVIAHGSSYISYFNEFAGGSKNGHKWLMGSNIDWRQDYFRLLAWQKSHPERDALFLIGPCTYNPADLGIKNTEAPPFLPGRPQYRNADGVRGPAPGWYAVSLSSYYGRNTMREFDYLRRMAIDDRIGDSLLMVHVSEQEAALLSAELQAEERIDFPDLWPADSSAL
ncbi:MAG: glycosyltransferase family 39 protein [Planctomycetaceae bacterium]|nr:glycosyltransferase family 39 protein [Planctomycetaceae bacterium]